MIKGFTVWFTGLPCAGKTSLAHALSLALRRNGLACAHLDGDALRLSLSKDLGFSKSDRKKHVLRVAGLARRLAKSGTIALVALISPYRKTRLEARRLIGDFVEIYVRCPIKICEARDVKGLYRLARQRKIRHFTGVSDPYEAPLSPEIVLRTDKENIGACVKGIMDYLLANGWIEPAGRKNPPATARANPKLRV